MQNSKKNRLFAMICAAALTLGLGACSGSGGSSSAPAAEPSVAESVAEAPASGAEASTEDPADVGSGGIASLDDLVGKTIGVQLGTTGDIFAEDIEDATIERFNKGADAVMALKQGKVDAVIIDDQPAKVFASQNDDIMILDEPFEVEEYAICLSKDKADLTAEFNSAIAELKADGTLQAILDYYIGQVEGSEPYSSPEGLDYSKGTLIMGTNAEFPPYEYREGNEIKGVDADFARAICDKLGYQLEIQDMAFDAIIVAVQSGKADFGAAGMTKTEERLMSVDFTESYCTATQVVIVKK